VLLLAVECLRFHGRVTFKQLLCIYVEFCRRFCWVTYLHASELLAVYFYELFLEIK